MTVLEPAVRLFGSVTVSVGPGATAVPGGKPAGVLAVLALHAGQVVSIDMLVDALWGARPPTSARALIHTYVSGLRHVLADAGPTAPRVDTVPGGYRLGLEPNEVDVLRFLSSAVSAEVTIEELEATLRWSGNPLLFNLDASFVEPWRRRVDSARATAQTRVWAAQLKEDDVSGVIPELQAAVHQHPLREDTVLMLAEALGASGRQREALAVLDGYRLRLGEELGLDPSLRLAELRQQLLTTPTPPTQARSGEGAQRFGAGAAATAAVPRRRRLLVGATVIVVLAVAVVGFASWRLPIREYRAGAATGGPALLVLDSSSGEIQTRIGLPVQPSEAEVSGDLIWVRSEIDRALAVVDLTDPAGQRVFGLSEPPTALAVTGRSATVGLGYSGHVLTVTEQGVGAPQAVIPNVAGRMTLATRAEEVWAATIDGRIRALSGVTETTPRLQVTGAPRWMAVDSARIWILSSDRRNLVAVNRADGSEVASPLRGEPVAVAATDGDAWAVTSGDNRLWRASASGARIVATRALPGEPAGISVSSDRVWVAVGNPATLLSYDRVSLELIDSIDLPQEPADLAARPGLVIIAAR